MPRGGLRKGGASKAILGPDLRRNHREKLAERLAGWSVEYAAYRAVVEVELCQCRLQTGNRRGFRYRRLSLGG